MTLVLHSSSLISPPNHSVLSSWQQLISRKFRFQAMMPSDPRKIMLSGQGAASETSKTSFTFPLELHMSRLLSGMYIFKTGKTFIHVSPPRPENTSQSLNVNQEIQIIRFPAMALLLTNAMLMTMPLEALAETCEADNSLFNMPVLLFVALVGATVGGLVARQRKEELQRVNEQLRQINAALRRQAKIESYAPALSYAPVGGRVSEAEVIVDPKKQELISRLKTGKNYLRNLNPDKAFTEFKIALELAQELNDPIEEKKAARGLGASLQRQGKYQEAIEYHKRVLAISKRVRESSGNTEAYGAIADCYTELGDLEKAGKFYDKYIARLEAD